MRHIAKQSGFLLLMMLLLSSFSTENNSKRNSFDSKKPQKIIFMIGDGMGITQVYAAMTVQKGQLQMARCTHTGFVKTNSASSYVTDSAAGGTALACGQKVNNGVLGITPTGDSIKSLFDYARAIDLSTGFAVTCAVTHATPASFYAHQNSRDNTEAIAMDLALANVDFWIGGGLKSFTDRADKRNLKAELTGKDYMIIDDLSAFMAGTTEAQQQVKKGKPVKIGGLLYEEHPPRLSKGREGYFPKAVSLAIDALDNDPDGFFLMVEASQIDWGGHLRSDSYVIEETVEFDQIIGQVLDYAEKDGNTLVIITADHETGGMTLPGGDLATGEVKAEFTTFDHTGTLIPVFAYGPGAELFTGIMENTELNAKVHSLLAK